jgi:hypothetical protein
MATIMVNLTLIKVIREMENILSIYPVQTYKQVAENPDLQQKLVAYILNRLPNKYITIDEEQLTEKLSQNISCSTWEQLEIEELVQQGIYYLVNLGEQSEFLLSPEIVR